VGRRELEKGESSAPIRTTGIHMEPCVASPSPAKMDPISNNGNPHRDPPMEASLTRFPWFGSKRDAHHLDQQGQQEQEEQEEQQQKG
jgi:hypothetical protein